MKKFAYILPFLVLIGCFSVNPKSEAANTISKIEKQLRRSIEIFDSLRTTELVSPRSVGNDTIKMVPASDWCSGFYAGELWMIYQYTNDEFWKGKALEFTLPLEQEKWNGKTHDMGFKMYCSFGKAYQSTLDSKYRDILIQSAKTLATRFDPKVGCIRSWDHHQDKWQFPVIIDNMMNLELLFWAAKETGNSMFYDVAVTHAETTMKNHYRSDFSCYHVVDYNPETGAVNEKTTHQGYSAESAWSRGQAWSLYGFTMVYRESRDARFLDQAEKIAEYILNQPNLPKDLIPYWDFDALAIPNEPRDVSAASIMASALIELSGYIPEKKTKYLNSAKSILATLGKSYGNTRWASQGFILGHSTGSKPANSEVDAPIVYADYYYLESLLRLENENTKHNNKN